MSIQSIVGFEDEMSTNKPRAGRKIADLRAAGGKDGCIDNALPRRRGYGLLPAHVADRRLGIGDTCKMRMFGWPPSTTLLTSPRDDGSFLYTKHIAEDRVHERVHCEADRCRHEEQSESGHRTKVLTRQIVAAQS